MSDTFERPAMQSSAVADRSHGDRDRPESSPESAFGRARELTDAGYREMPNAAPAGDDDSFGSDYSGLGKAAEHLAVSRQPARKVLSRQYLTGDGAEADEREAVTLHRAAEDLAAARTSDAEAMESVSDRQRDGTDTTDVSFVDDLESTRSEGQPLRQGEERLSLDEHADTHVDPVVQEALKHPQVRQAIEEQVGRAEAARQNYDQALDVVGGMLREVVFAQFPELKSHTAQQFEAALTLLSQQDPARYGQARALADRLSAVQVAQSLQQQQRDAAQRQEFAEYARTEDARFDELVKGQKPETVQRVANEIIAYAAELGVPREQFLQLCATEPVMRNAAFQKMMFDAASYRLLQRARNEIAKKVVPPVQRPGASPDPRAALNEGDLRSVNARFANNPSVKNAAEVLAAQRAVSRQVRR